MTPKTILITGAAGFIGYHVTKALLDQGHQVVAVDMLNDYYDVNLKLDRLAQLGLDKNACQLSNEAQPVMQNQLSFYRFNLADASAVQTLSQKHPEIEYIVHLAAQAGVRYSLSHPHVYVECNISSQINLLDLARSLNNCQHFLYASSSSVYGKNSKLPFSVQDRVDQPMAPYAVTKRTAELLAYTYGHLYQLPSSGLRYFTVYGPWGRPDMAAHIFANAINKGENLPLFNHGQMQRNFSYIDDIVAGTIACLFREQPANQTNPAKIYNLGNDKTEHLGDFVSIIADLLAKPAKIQPLDLQPGDVPATMADLTESQADFGFKPKTHIQQGLSAYIDWYSSYYIANNR